MLSVWGRCGNPTWRAGSSSLLASGISIGLTIARVCFRIMRMALGLQLRQLGLQGCQFLPMHLSKAHTSILALQHVWTIICMLLSSHQTMPCRGLTTSLVIDSCE